MNINKIILFLFIFFLILPDGSSQANPDSKNVLVLFSMAPSTPAYRIMFDGIRTGLENEFGTSINIHTEFLEAEGYPRGSYPREKFNIYNDKYREVGLDLMICIGIDLVSIVKTHADQYLLDLPVISMDYDFSDVGFKTDILLNDKTVAIPINVNAIRTISTALSFFPATRSIYLVCGISAADNWMRETVMKALDEMNTGLQINLLENISMDDVLHFVKNLPDSSLIFIPNFNVDARQVPYFNNEAVRLISSNASAPVFAFTDTGFGEGSFGGYIVSFRKMGLLAGQLAIRILNGTDPKTILITEKDIYEMTFDWRQLKMWGLLHSKLIPDGSSIRFEEAGFFEKYKTFILIAIGFLVLQSLLIVNLVRLYRRQRLITRKLIAAENNYRELVREDRILRIGQLTASLSHELNQPLTAILSTAQAGLRFVDSGNSDPELLREIFKNITEDDKRAASIISSIRGMMKMEKREKERINLNAKIEEIINIFQSDLGHEKISLEILLIEGPVYVIADPIQIQQVIMNFIINAIQSVSRSGAKRRTIVIREKASNGEVTVSVRDYGAGIEAALMGKLFHPFVTSEKEGTGIGLSICRAIIDDHQGKIWAENEADSGATFSFSLKTVSG